MGGGRHCLGTQWLEYEIGKKCSFPDGVIGLLIKAFKIGLYKSWFSTIIHNDKDLRHLAARTWPMIVGYCVLLRLGLIFPVTTSAEKSMAIYHQNGAYQLP